MTPDELREIGERMYGRGWRKHLVEALPVSDRMIRYWLSGKHPIRELVARRIRSLETKEGE